MKKLKSFTLIELIISISAFSLITLTIMKFYQDFQIEEGKLSREDKFTQLAQSIENAMSENYLFFTINRDIVYFDMSVSPNMATSSISNEKIKRRIPFDDMIKVYQANTFYPLYDSSITDAATPGSIELSRKIFNLTKKEMELFVNEPFDFIFTTNKSSYLGMDFPFKDIYLFNWNEVRLFKNFGQIQKACLINGNSGFTIMEYDDLSSSSLPDPTDPTSTLDCDTIIESLIDDNEGLYEQLNSSNYRTSYNFIKNKISMYQISNFNFNLDKIKQTYTKFMGIIHNLKDYAKREIEFATNDKETMLDHFIFCYFDRSSSATNHCRVNKGDVSEDQTNVNKIKFMIGQESWNGSTNASRTVDTIQNAIFTVLRNSSVTDGTNPVTDIRGTTALNNRTLEYLDGKVEMKGLMSIEYPQSFGTSDANDSTLVFNPFAYEIFGTRTAYNSGTNPATESFLGIPFFFSNVSISSINVEAEDSSGSSVTVRKAFPINTPIIQSNGMYSTGPYAAILVAVFPWIYDIDDEELSSETLNDGYFVFQVESSK